MTVVWLFNTPYNPLAGGTEKMTQLLARGLTNDGHKCLGQIYINQTGGISFYSFSDCKCIRIRIVDLYSFLSNLQVDIVINQLGNEKWLLQSFLNVGGLKWHNEGGSIVSCHHFNTKWPSAYYYASTKLHKNFRDYIEMLRTILLSRHYNRIQLDVDKDKYRFVYDNSDYYVTLSKEYNDYFVKAAEINDTTKLISIGNPLSFESISPPEIIDRKKKVVLICARMDEIQKRISLALKIWKSLMLRPELDEWILKIVGDGEDLPAYKQIVQNEGIRNVLFEGRQYPEPYYKEASILLMTSGYEGWGLTLTEGLQRGVVPIVMNTSPVFKDIITHGYNGYISRGSSIKQCVNYLLQLMTDCRRLNAMGNNALYSAQRFTIEKTMEQWRKIIPPAIQ